MTLADRLRAHEPAAIREVYDAIEAERGILSAIATRLRIGGAGSARATAAARIVALAGLDEQLAAVQQQHDTGRAGRRPRARVRALVQITGAPLEVLTKSARAACVDDKGPGAAWAMAELELDETGAIRGRLVKEG